ISVKELEEAAKAGLLQEAFGLGTAATVSVMSTIGFADGDYLLPDAASWSVAPQIKAALDSVRLGTGEDKHGWNIPV
ncbi:MAG: branched-chain amino acid aminotransferase, partial [Flavobacteriales bacterium]